MERTKELQTNVRRFVRAFLLAAVFILALSVNMSRLVCSAAGQGKVIAANGAKVRKEAATSSEMVASAALNQVVTINSSVQGSDGKTWYQVTVDGVNGYIRSDLVQTTDGGSAEPAATSAAPAVQETPADVTVVNPVSATVTGGQSVRIRSNASTTSQIVTTAASGLALTVTGQATGSDGKVWYQVNFISNGSSVDGFIRSDYVNLSGELTPYTEEPQTPESPEPEAPETTPEPQEQKAYETVLQDGEWYLVVTETNEGYVIQDIFDSMKNNVTEYAKLEKKVKSDKIVIVILVILLVGAGAGAAFLFFKLKDLSDASYFNEVEKETLRRRNDGRPDAKRVMHTVGAEKQGGARPAGGRPAGAQGAARPAGSRPAGAQGAARPAGNRPAGAQGAARPAGSRPAGTVQPGARPAGSRPAGAQPGARPAGSRPAGAQPGARPASAQQGGRPAAARSAAAPKPEARPADKEKNGWQAKNFMADDDDEFEFEFLNYDGEDEQ